MRILQINNFHFLKGGSDRYFLHVTDLLKKEGHEVATFSADHPLSIHRDWLATSPPHGTDTENPKSVMNIVNYLYSFDAKKNMELAIERFKPDIAHLHIYYGQLTSSILAPLKAAGIPIVQTLHEYKLVCPTHALYAQGKYCDTCQGHNYWKALSKRCNRGSLARTTLSVIESYISDALGSKNKVDHYIAVSEFQKQQLVRLGIPQEKLSVLYHFSDLSSAIITKTRNHFLYVGRIEEDKGIKVLLNAYADLKKGSPPLFIVGRYQKGDAWQDYCEKLDIASKVKWLGFKDGNELDNIYRESIAVINPSLLNETFGLTCLEALARGCPVIASRIGAFPEVITDGQDGILFDPGDVGMLTEAMFSMLCNPEETFQMGQRGIEKVERLFSREKHYEGLMEAYDKVL